MDETLPHAAATFHSRLAALYESEKVDDSRVSRQRARREMSVPHEADRLIEMLDLKPHPEGGYFRETFRDANGEGRARSTAIYFLLKGGEVSRWHRIDVPEVWHFYRGAPLELTIGKDRYVLGNDIDKAQVPQLVVPAGQWQMARSQGEFSLVGCTVAPGFEFEHFELAPEGFQP
jgi:predicted cupin superfamily sugar epimerase